jgi:hypothetical protein
MRRFTYSQNHTRITTLSRLKTKSTVSVKVELNQSLVQKSPHMDLRVRIWENVR